MSLINRFYAKVKKTDDCWIWIGAKKPTGYGNFKMNAKYVGAHVASFVLHKGDVTKGQVVCHHCDNPSCVNPDHLFVGSYQDNLKDMVKKGRAKAVVKGGEYHPMAKLTNSAVVEIRKRRANGEYLASIAKDFGVCEATICNVAKNNIWKKASEHNVFLGDKE